MNKHRKLRKADLEKFKRQEETAIKDQQAVSSAMREQIQAIYKVWSAFTKALRAIIVKYFDDDLVIKTVHFGKFYCSKLDKNYNSRSIVY